MTFQIGDIVQIKSKGTPDFDGLIGEIVGNTSALKHNPSYYMVDLGHPIRGHPRETLWTCDRLDLVPVDNIPEEW